MKFKILYEDNHLIAVEKPAGVLTQGDSTNDISLMDEVKKYLKAKYKKPGNVFLGLLHRLDWPVSGIVLFAKTSKGASRLSEQFRSRLVEKRYDAIVLGKLNQKEGTLINYLKKDTKQKKMTVLKKPEPYSQKAELFYRVVASNDKYSLLKIRLKTGRFHQIRAQLAFAGFPILGDLKYGGSAVLADKSIALQASYLSFRLAAKDGKKEISLPIPAAWRKYLI